MHLKRGGGFFPCCIPHRPGISRANKPPACHISTGVSLAPRRKIPNHSFPFLNWHTEARAGKRLVSYKRETGRGNWGGEQQINLIAQNVPFLRVFSFSGIRSYFDKFHRCFAHMELKWNYVKAESLFTDIICQTTSSTPFMSVMFYRSTSINFMICLNPSVSALQSSHCMRISFFILNLNNYDIPLSGWWPLSPRILAGLSACKLIKSSFFTSHITHSWKTRLMGSTSSGLNRKTNDISPAGDGSNYQTKPGREKRFKNRKRQLKLPWKLHVW